jgi:signal transduction histidine kinase
METVTILWSIGAAVAITLAVVCGLVWVIERRDPASLMLCVLGVATAASAYGELGMLRSATPEEYGQWLGWYHLPVGSALVAMVLFVRFYLGTGRTWLVVTFIVARTVVLLVNFSVQPNFNFSSIDSLRSVSLFGEHVSTIGVARPREWQWFAVASLILLMGYLFDALVQQWRKGRGDSRRKAAAVALGIAFPLLCTIVYTQLLVFGVLRVPVSNLPWFLGALVVMASELGRDFILSRRERLELAELRGRLAQVDRVSLLGQLAATLAHELNQPLAATTANVEAGLIQLKSEKPDVEELRAILGDIRADHRRAAEIISHMRELFKRRTIEMQPLRVEDVVQDVVALVRPEAMSRNIVLSLHLRPGLPRVSGDRVHLSQVILNLLMNSIHAVQSCAADKRLIIVEAKANTAKGEVEIAVRDSGPGIPESMMSDVFRPFFTTKSDGMGMGLALSRTIVETHGGQMWADHKIMDGAIFRFTLQQATAVEAHGAVEARPHAEHRPARVDARQRDPAYARSQTELPHRAEAVALAFGGDATGRAPLRPSS